jgi:hypothetical protein
MGVLLKFILFAVVFIYLVRKVGGLVYRLMGGKPPQQNPQQQYRKQGDINVDYSPKGKKDKFGNDFKGGEYVDYEEVK